MSNNEGNIQKAARWHRPAIIGIVVALALAALAAFVFAPIGGGAPEPGGQAAPGTDALAPATTPGAEPVAGGQATTTTTPPATTTPATN